MTFSQVIKEGMCSTTVQSNNMSRPHCWNKPVQELWGAKDKADDRWLSHFQPSALKDDLDWGGCLHGGGVAERKSAEGSSALEVGSQGHIDPFWGGGISKVHAYPGSMLTLAAAVIEGRKALLATRAASGAGCSSTRPRAQRAVDTAREPDASSAITDWCFRHCGSRARA